MLRTLRIGPARSRHPTACGALAACLAACNGQVIVAPSASPDGGTGASGARASGSTEAVTVVVEIPAGIATSTISYVFDGPSGFTSSGTVAATGTQTQFTIDGVPPVGSYSLGISTTSPDATSTCAANLLVDVLPATVTRVIVTPMCTGSANVGSGAATTATTGANPPSPPDASTSATPPPTATGSLDVSATLPSGLSFSSVQCAITGPNGLDFNDSLSLTSDVLEFTVQNLPAEMGESLVLTATTADGREVCRATTMFDVFPDQRTETTLFFVCSAG